MLRRLIRGLYRLSHGVASAAPAPAGVPTWHMVVALTGSISTGPRSALR